MDIFSTIFNIFAIAYVISFTQQKVAQVWVQKNNTIIHQNQSKFIHLKSSGKHNFGRCA